VNLRAISLNQRPKPRLPAIPPNGEGKPGGDPGRVFAGGQWLAAQFVSREALGSGSSGLGPVVIEEATATSYIPPGWRFSVNPSGHIDVTRG
jgi:N-methylhydantoinase A